MTKTVFDFESAHFQYLIFRGLVGPSRWWPAIAFDTLSPV